MAALYLMPLNMLPNFMKNTWEEFIFGRAAGHKLATKELISS